MHQYLELLNATSKGPYTMDRTGTGTNGIFGWQMRFNLQEGFPLLTTKKLHLKSIIHELLWFLAGDTNVKYLQENGVHIWDEWADENGNLGPVYGKQWRSWARYKEYPGGEVYLDGKIDQIKDLIAGLKLNPYGRRHIVSAWNPVEIPHMKLPPCHCLFQFCVKPATFAQRLSHYKGKAVGNRGVTPDDALALHEEMNAAGVPTQILHCQLYQRSADIFLGVPFNIASYALLTMMVAQVTGMIAGDFIHTLGDAHLYSNHREQAKEQLSREPRTLPTMRLSPDVTDIFSFQFSDFSLFDYDPHPAIKGEVSV